MVPGQFNQQQMKHNKKIHCGKQRWKTGWKKSSFCEGLRTQNIKSFPTKNRGFSSPGGKTVIST